MAGSGRSHRGNGDRPQHRGRASAAGRIYRRRSDPAYLYLYVRPLISPETVSAIESPSARYLHKQVNYLPGGKVSHGHSNRHRTAPNRRGQGRPDPADDGKQRSRIPAVGGDSILDGGSVHPRPRGDRQKSRRSKRTRTPRTHTVASTTSGTRSRAHRARATARVQAAHSSGPSWTKAPS